MQIMIDDQIAHLKPSLNPETEILVGLIHLKEAVDAFYYLVSIDIGFGNAENQLLADWKKV